MEARSSQSSLHSNPSCISPVTTSPLIKEISKEIDDLRKENFKLKLHIFLLEEKSADKGDLEHLKRVKINVQAHAEKVDLKKQIQDLQCQLREKDKLLNKNMQTICSKDGELNEAKKIIQDLQTRIFNLIQKMQSEEEIFSPVCLENSLTVKQTFDLDEASISKLPLDVDFCAKVEAEKLKYGVAKLQSQLEARFHEFQDARERIFKLEKDNEELKAKGLVKNKAIKALMHKLAKSSSDKHDELSRIIQIGMHAAESGNVDEVASSINTLKHHFSQVLSKPVSEIFSESPPSSLQSTFTVSLSDSENGFCNIEHKHPK